MTGWLFLSCLPLYNLYYNEWMKVFHYNKDMYLQYLEKWLFYTCIYKSIPFFNCCIHTEIISFFCCYVVKNLVILYAWLMNPDTECFVLDELNLFLFVLIHCLALFLKLWVIRRKYSTSFLSSDNLGTCQRN